eukprot:3941179-Rhodomonas_salina.1
MAHGGVWRMVLSGTEMAFGAYGVWRVGSQGCYLRQLLNFSGRIGLGVCYAVSGTDMGYAIQRWSGLIAVRIWMRDCTRLGSVNSITYAMCLCGLSYSHLCACACFGTLRLYVPTRVLVPTTILASTRPHVTVALDLQHTSPSHLALTVMYNATVEW